MTHMMSKDHMENGTDCSRTRCGQDVNHTKGYLFEYGSPKATCKMCQRLHAQDMAKENNNCTKCRLSDPDNDYVCSIEHAQTTTTNDQGQIVKVGYYACELACPDFKLCGGDSQ